MRILFVKTSSLGDVIHHCPAVSDAARRVPGAQIDWVVEDTFAEIAGMHHAVHRVIPVAVRRWRRAPWRTENRQEFAAFRKLLAGERYDRIVDTQGLMKSALITRLARGARHGYDRGSAREPFAARLYAARHPVSRSLHAVERNRRLTAAALGYTFAGSACDYGLRAPEGMPFAVGGPYCVLLTMTSRADKLWPDEHWIALGMALAARGIAAVLPWGSKTEQARAHRIADALDGALVPPPLGIGQLGSLVSHAKAVVGVDTGLTHLGVALGVPAVGIYCTSDPLLTGLYGSPRAKNVGGIGSIPAAAQVLASLDEATG
ncbi:MAG: lipopolysaccharide heptosyltransferase I [Betaproteobacteria bacterium]|nr:lipopolysaccharide heptosyltransferase I [Betaproteobacteria bacterium]